MAMRSLAIGIVMLVAGGSAAGAVVFYDGFETGMSNWSAWQDLSWVSGTAGCNRESNCWGPFQLFQSDNHPRTGSKCARQEQAQPWWYGSRIATPLILPPDKTVRLSVWQFEDANPMFRQPATNPPAPGDPRQYHDHDQVQGWVCLMGGEGGEEETEFFAIGVHAHWASPEPVLDWWRNLSWSTGWDSWHTTSFARAQGFRHLEIWVHPYTGGPADVQFFINGEKVGEAPRLPGSTSTGVPVRWIALGANPTYMAEDYIANTYEFFWYDDVKVTVGALGDYDDDGDADLADFSHFQTCFNGPNRPAADPVACLDADMDSDGDVDLADFGVFQACFNGPNNPVPAACR